ncbi:MAG: hypothetical protein JWM19_950 [Actinomycetia bacterium]|nr:hypothetical protein [Actinomycetes bacterium]
MRTVFEVFEISALALVAAAAWWNALAAPRRPYEETWITTVLCLLAGTAVIAVILSAS